MLGDNNGVAVGMMMLLPFFVALAQTSTRRWERYLHRFFIVGVVYRCISTYSRGGFLTAAAVGLVMLWYSPHKVRAFVLVGAMAFGVTFLMPQSFWNRMQTITRACGEPGSGFGRTPDDVGDGGPDGRRAAVYRQSGSTVFSGRFPHTTPRAPLTAGIAPCTAPGSGSSRRWVTRV